MEKLSGYIKDHLTDYIRTELDHGYSMESIKNVLLNYHHKDIVDAAIEELKDDGFKAPKKRAKSKIKKLDKRLFLEIVNMLQDYIIRQKRRGYESHHIVEALINFGHSRDTVKAAINAVEYGQEPLFVEPFDYEKTRKILFPVSLLLFIIFVVGLSYSVNENLIKMSVLFFPALLTIFLTRGFISTFKYKQALLGFPVALCLLYYLAGTTGQFFFQGVELENLSVMNFMFAFIYTFFYIGAKPEVVETEKEDLVKGFNPPKEIIEEEFGKEDLSEKEIDKLIEDSIKKQEEKLKPIELEVK